TAIADGMACRTPEPAALEELYRGVERIVEVTDEEIACAMRTLFECTHNVSEGAGAAALAAAQREQPRLAGRRVAIVLSGGNVDRDVYTFALGAVVPRRGSAGPSAHPPLDSTATA